MPTNPTDPNAPVSPEKQAYLDASAALDTAHDVLVQARSDEKTAKNTEDAAQAALDAAHTDHVTKSAAVDGALADCEAKKAALDVAAEAFIQS